MNRRNIISLSTIAALGLAVLPGVAVAQQKTIKEQIVGTWLLVSAETANANGTKFMPFGPTPKGTLNYDASGRYSILNINPAIPKLASGNRVTGTAEENKAVVGMSIGVMGTYTVDEGSKTILQHVEASTYPNWNGEDQKRPIISINADTLSFTNPAPTTGAGATVFVWKRAK